MEKLLTFLPYTPTGEQVVIPITDTRSYEFNKTAATLVPEISEYINTLKPDAKRTYLLVNALGAGEYWSSNVNGDYFEEKELLKAYPTFLNAHPFEHHINKDPKKALGSVEVAAWNSEMRRVELILSIDNEKAPHIVKRVNEGEYPAVSMGARVNHDLCSICGNKAGHVREYCDHLKQSMNEILPDGRKVFALNPNPKFFDISFVLIGADKTAYVLKKVASANARTELNIEPSAWAAIEKDAEKVDRRELAKKLAKIYKDIPADEVKVIRQCGDIMDKDILPVIERYEKPMPKEAIDKLASYEMDEILSTLTFSGIVLQSQEFQRLALVKTGKAQLADTLEDRGIVLSYEEGGGESDDNMIKESSFSSKVFNDIKEFMPSRSVYSPFLDDRVEKLVKRASRTPLIVPLPGGGTQVIPTKEKSTGKEFAKLMAALGLGYFLYRKSVPKANFSGLDKILAEHPAAAAALLGATSVGLAVGSQAFAPTETEKMLVGQGLAKRAGFAGRVLTPLAASYLASASLTGKQARGQRLNRFERFLAQHPMAVGLTGSLIGARSALPKVASSSEIPASVEKEAGVLGESAFIFGPGWLKPTLPTLLGVTADVAAFNLAAKALKGMSKKQTQEGAVELVGKSIKPKQKPLTT